MHLGLPDHPAIYQGLRTQLYNQVKAVLGRQRVVMPPSPAMAGIYAAVDRDRGVWKAPANVSVASVSARRSRSPTTTRRPERRPTAGKSINAIRGFTGKGTLVWGARTLAGNDNEWRYVTVRRLFNMIEESLARPRPSPCSSPTTRRPGSRSRG